MADDLSARELGCYGHPEHRTPNLDKLAATGVRFSTCWATPICSPSRAEIMTGRYGFRTGWFHNDLRTPEPLCKNSLTIGQVMKSARYATAIAGKWQLPGLEKEHGLRENTVVIFTGDNATASYGKSRVDAERGPRVPMIVNCPGLVKPLGACDELVDFSDVPPTLADLAGASKGGASVSLAVLLCNRDGCATLGRRSRRGCVRRSCRAGRD